MVLKNKMCSRWDTFWNGPSAYFLSPDSCSRLGKKEWGINTSKLKIHALSSSSKYVIQSLEEKSLRQSVCYDRENWPFLQRRGTLTLSLTSKNGATYLIYHFILVHYLFCEIFMVEKSKEDCQEFKCFKLVDIMFFLCFDR